MISTMSEMQQIRAELDALKMHYDSTVTELRAERGHNNRERRKLRIQAGLVFLAFLAAVFVSPSNRAALAQGTSITLATLNTRLLAVEAKTQYQVVNTTAKSTTFSGCNVFINDGGGTTDTFVHNAAGDGLGNLIIGYNALRGLNRDNRAGVHNLIVGDQQNYASYGGFVAGNYNTVSGEYASVSGGAVNTAKAEFSSVSGGYLNTASAYYSSVSAGILNTASGHTSSVSGGGFNTASNDHCSISGGEYNTASNPCASVSGGGFNTARGELASISGGVANTVGGYASSVGGGNGVSEINAYGWAAGGQGSGAFHNP